MIERELTCEVCDFPFTDEEWEHRHTADDGSDVHERCCLCDSPTVSTTGDLTLVRHDAHHPGSPTVEVPVDWPDPETPWVWDPPTVPGRVRLVAFGALIGAAVAAAVAWEWRR
jgi:hypothetical protein